MHPHRFHDLLPTLQIAYQEAITTLLQELSKSQLLSILHTQQKTDLQQAIVNVMTLKTWIDEVKDNKRLSTDHPNT